MNEHSQELDALRARLARLDPQAGQPVAPITPERKERAMTTTATPAATPTPGRSRRPLLVAAAAVLAVAAVGGTAVALSSDDEAAPPTTLALSAAPLDISSICLPVSAEGLRGAEVAFAGTVTSVDGTSAVLDVTEWFRGGDADNVAVSQEGGADAAALDGVAFEVGTTYLVAASATTIGSCSGSGPDGPELRALFDQAFAG